MPSLKRIIEAYLSGLKTYGLSPWESIWLIHSCSECMEAQG